MSINKGTLTSFFVAIAAVLLQQLICAEQVAAAWYNTAGWQYRIKITVQSSQVNGDQTDFPVYVDLDDMPAAFFDNVKSDGSDIRVTKTDGSTEVAREVVFVNTTANDGELYFKAAGTLSGSSNTDYYLYYGNAAASEPTANGQYAKENVWNGNNFAGVWHMQEDPSGSAPQVKDSTLNDNDCTSYGSMTSADLVTGNLAGNGMDLDGSNDYFRCGSDTSLDNLDDFTVSSWIYTHTMPSGGGWDCIACKVTSGQNESYYLYHNVGVHEINNYVGGSNAKYSSSTTVDLNTWAYFHSLMDFSTGGANTVEIYKDGVEVSYSQSDTTGSGRSSDAAVDFYIGSETNPPAGHGYYDGVLDELRIANVKRAEGWINTEYNNMSSPATFYTVGAQEEPGWYDTSWGYRIKLTIDADKVNGDQTDFPVYVDLDDMPDAFFDNINSDGRDIRVTSNDGTTEVARDVVFVNTTSNDGELHFKAAGTLSGTSNSEWYLYYGNATATEPTANGTYAKENVWNGSYYAVWHMQEDPNTSGERQMKDSTSANNDGDALGYMVSADSVAGQLAGNAVDFDGSDDRIDYGDMSSIEGIDKLSFSAWVNYDTASDWSPIFGKWVSSSSDTSFIFGGSGLGDNQGLVTVIRNGGNTLSYSAGGLVSLDTWHHVATSFDATVGVNADRVVTYLNSDEIALTEVGTYPATTVDNAVNGTAAKYGSNDYDGITDELRIAKIILSPGWVDTEYNNQSSPSTFYSVGSEVEATFGVSSFSPADNATAAATTNDLVIYFNDIVDIQTGNITIKLLSDNSTFQTIDVTSASVTGNGTSAITIDANDFATGTDYYVNIDASAFDDNDGNSYAGISDNGTWNFTTGTWFNGDWSNRIRITIDADKVAADLTDFPVYVDLDDMPDAFFDNVKSDGSDIRVTLANGTGLVPREVVTVDTTANAGELHFKVPGTLSSTSNSDFYLYYGNAGASAPTANGEFAKENVWNGNDYAAVWHMQEDPSGSGPQMLDSTFNDNDGTSSGTMTGGDSVSGHMGNALDFDGSNDLIDVPDDDTLDLTKITASFWINFTGDDNVAWPSPMCKKVANNAYQFFVTNLDRVRWSIEDSGVKDTEDTDAPVIGSYEYWTGTYDGAISILYRDAVSQDTTVHWGAVDTTTGTLNIGACTTTYAVYAKMDEVRLSTVARSQDWITTEYNNQNSPSTFYNLGSAESEADTTNPTVSTYSPTDGATGVAVDTNLVLTFDEAVDAETGNITIKKLSDNSTVETIAVGSVTGSGTTTITINPVSDLAGSTDYYINIAATCFDDAAGNSYAGITDNGTWNFTTGASDNNSMFWGGQ